MEIIVCSLGDMMEEQKEEINQKENLKENSNEQEQVILDVDQKHKKKKLSVSVLKIASEVVSIFLIVFFIIVVFSSVTGKGQNGIGIGPFKIYAIITGSMQPAIKQGDAVLVMSVPKDELHIEDVITFMPGENENIMVTHRIVSYGDDEDLFITRGDANNADDSPVHYNNVVGKVVCIIPLLGVLITIGSTPGGMALLIASFVLLMVLIEISKRIIKKAN